MEENTFKWTCFKVLQSSAKPKSHFPSAKGLGCLISMGTLESLKHRHSWKSFLVATWKVGPFLDSSHWKSLLKHFGKVLTKLLYSLKEREKPIQRMTARIILPSHIERSVTGHKKIYPRTAKGWVQHLHWPGLHVCSAWNINLENRYWCSCTWMGHRSISSHVNTWY